MKYFFEKKLILNAVLFLIVVLFVYWLLNYRETAPTSAWLLKNLHSLQGLYSSYPVTFIFVFCLLHFLSACLSLPGSCTTLNLLAGGVFGYKLGCAIVYPITIFSGCVGYFVGKKLPLNFLKERYAAQIELLRKKLTNYDHTSLVMLRLSPFLPYGVLNLLCGFLGIPFLSYLMTTIVGIFFDVVLLNSAGAFVAGDLGSSWQDKRNLMIIFLALFFVTYFIKIFRTKSIVENDRIE